MAVAKKVEKKTPVTKKEEATIAKKTVSKKEVAVVETTKKVAPKKAPKATVVETPVEETKKVVAKAPVAPPEVATAPTPKKAPTKEPKESGFPAEMKVGQDKFVHVTKGISNKMIHEAVINRFGAVVVMVENEYTTALLVTYAKATLHCIDISSKDVGYKDSYIPLQVQDIKNGFHQDIKHKNRQYPVALYLREDLVAQAQ